jgi:hypothetical protein
MMYRSFDGVSPEVAAMSRSHNESPIIEAIIVVSVANQRPVEGEVSQFQLTRRI